MPHTRTMLAEKVPEAQRSVWDCVCGLQSEQALLFDAMKTELLEKIRRLEEDRQNVDLTSGHLLRFD